MNICGEIAPFYFGEPDKELFGCLHVPEPGCRRDCGVVICQPFGHEYVNSHRALRQLASRLVDAGFPVLRFDYCGCGDSRGEVTETNIAEWVFNVSQAVAEVQQRVEVSNICLVGLRLGASLAMLNARTHDCAASLVLWDPIIDGRSYLNELIALQKEMLRFRPKPPRAEHGQYPLDIFGFPMSDDLCRSIREIDLLRASQTVTEQVLLVQTESHEGSDELRMILRTMGALVRHECFEGPKIWLPTVDGSLLVPGRVLQSITSWLIETHP
jgi:pimeloyl-ACP methyl ester carboxylesterase